jgi:penicillin amidase
VEAVYVLPEAMPGIRSAIEHLAVWDCRMEPDRVAASIFNVFFNQWCERVADERFSGEAATLVAAAAGGLAANLLEGDPAGWFPGATERQQAIVITFLSTLEFLQQKFGSDMLNWGWGRLHPLQQKHYLSTRGDLAQLLDLGGMPVRGDHITVCNTGLAPDYSAPTGAGCRLIADLSDPHGGLWAVDAGSESGQPGSPHYNDQIIDWLTARYHYVPLKPELLTTSPETELTLKPPRV